MFGQEVVINQERGIKKLPEDVILQLKSTVAINDLSDVIIGLIKNSLDAGATRLDVLVDYRRGGCTVEDNGVGISPQDIMDPTIDGNCINAEASRIGRLHFTSKHGSAPETHGCRGTFLALLSSLALVKITSQHREHYSVNSITLHRAHVIDHQQEPLTESHSRFGKHGTTVLVRDLFGNMPVRVKQRAAHESHNHWQRQWKALHYSVLALLIAWPCAVHVSVKHVDENRHIRLTNNVTNLEQNSQGGKSRSTHHASLHVQRAISLLKQSELLTLMDYRLWVPLNSSSGKVTIKGSICLQAAPSKSVQFISIGVHPLSASSGHSELFDVVNRAFDNSDFGTNRSDFHSQQSTVVSSGHWGHSRSPKPRKAIDRWPMFIFYVALQDSKQSPTAPELLDRYSIFQTVTSLLSAMTQSWLEAQGFQLGANKHERTISPHLKMSSEARSTVKLASLGEKTIPAEVSQLKSGMSGVGAHSFQYRKSPLQHLSRVKNGLASCHDNFQQIPSPVQHSQQASSRQMVEHQVLALPSHPSRIRDEENGSGGGSGDLFGKDIHKAFEFPPHSGKILGKPSDKIVLWQDPVTGSKLNINSRTGAAILPRMEMMDSSHLRNERLIVPSPLASTSGTHPAETTPTYCERTASPWPQSILDRWDNPVFKLTEAPFLHADLGELKLNSSSRTIQGTNDTKAQNNYGISKSSLKRSTVIAQVDCKFILAMVHLQESRSAAAANQRTLVLIDQHAADERVKVEGLLSELCSPSTEGDQMAFKGANCRFRSTILSQPITCQFSTREVQLLKQYAWYFAEWSIVLRFEDSPMDQPGDDRSADADREPAHVIALPPVIAARVECDPRLIFSLLRSEIWRLEEGGSHFQTRASTFNVHEASKDDSRSTALWLRYFSSIPPPLLEMVNSRACRTAYMFNDVLDLEACEDLLARLACCTFPFMCAHGRPSMVPLTSLDSFGSGIKEGAADDFEGNNKSFADAYADWERACDI